MLPPIPHSLVPVTAQHDVIKPKPDIPPVTPTQPGAKEGALDLEDKQRQEVEEQMREQQRRHRRRGYTPEQLAQALPDDLVQEQLEELPRQGLWVDVQV